MTLLSSSAHQSAFPTEIAELIYPTLSEHLTSLFRASFAVNTEKHAILESDLSNLCYTPILA